MSNRLTISFGSNEELLDDVEDLLDDVNESGKSASARAVFKAAIEAAEDTDKNPCEAIVEGTSGEDLSYDYTDRRGSKLSADEVLEIVTTEDNPVINPVHIPTDIESEVTSTRRKVDICTAVLRYMTLNAVYPDLERQNHPKFEERYADRTRASLAVEETLGTGRDDYYLDPNKANIPGRVIDRLVKMPTLQYDDVDRSLSRSGRCAVDLPSEWHSAIVSVENINVDELRDEKIKKLLVDCKKLREMADEVALITTGDGFVESRLDDLELVRSQAVVEFNERDIDTGEDYWD